MARYLWKDGQWVDRKTGEPMYKPYAGRVTMPRVYGDIPEYRSPIDGKMITSRSHRREDLIRNDCVEMDPPRKPRPYKNPAFAKRWGVPLTEDGPRKDVAKEREYLAKRASGVVEVD